MLESDLRLLVVDDSPEIRDLISFSFSLRGMNVATAQNGQEAVAISWTAKSAGYVFDMILMDVEMPVMGGLEATILIRDSGFTGPIVAISGCSIGGIEQRCADAGCNEFLRKPIRLMSLHKMLERYCYVTQATRQASLI